MPLWLGWFMWVVGMASGWQIRNAYRAWRRKDVSWLAAKLLERGYGRCRYHSGQVRGRGGTDDWCENCQDLLILEPDHGLAHDVLQILGDVD